jgi:restriction system protein
MKEEIEKLAKSKQTAVKTLFAALKIIKAAGGSMPGKEVMAKMRESLAFSDWEKEIYEKTGYIRWESIFLFYSIDLIKAGYLRKNKRIWYLTEEGEKALQKGPLELMKSANVAYKQWYKENKLKDERSETEAGEEELTDSGQLQRATIDQLEIQAIEGIKDAINQKNAYEFQDLVAALLRAMKYYTPFISPKGRDGGLDVVAYRDPLGASEPRIKVQVKHKPDTTVPVNDIRSLVGLLNKSGDIGLFVTSGRFTNESEKFARDSHIHVRLIDIDAFIQLWQQFYDALTDEEKNWLPLHKVFFLGTNE